MNKTQAPRIYSVGEPRATAPRRTRFLMPGNMTSLARLWKRISLSNKILNSRYMTCGKYCEISRRVLGRKPHIKTPDRAAHGYCSSGKGEGGRGVNTGIRVGAIIQS
ncbi:hypothetical protein Peur_042511 [Populus x canadensis]